MMTSAPKSANIVAAAGPASHCDRSGRVYRGRRRRGHRLPASRQMLVVIVSMHPHSIYNVPNAGHQRLAMSVPRFGTRWGENLVPTATTNVRTAWRARARPPGCRRPAE